MYPEINTYRVLVPEDTKSGVTILYIAAVSATYVEYIQNWVARNFGENTEFMYEPMDLGEYIANGDVLLLWEGE